MQLYFSANVADPKARPKLRRDLAAVVRKLTGDLGRVTIAKKSPTDLVATVALTSNSSGDPESLRKARALFLCRKVAEKGWTHMVDLPPLAVEPDSKPVIPSTCTFDRSYFSHLFDRTAQIHIIEKAIQVAYESQFQERLHCILYGPPGGSKTEILRAISRMFGQNTVLELDATSTTKAGAERILTETMPGPRILLIEEIDKIAEEKLAWLLGVMDQRGEIVKTNHAIGTVRIKAAPLCLVATNDLKKIERYLAGALASRFAHKVYCPAPDRALLEKILQREIETRGGDPRWIAPTLDFCLNEEGTTNPRRIIGVFRTGAEGWLTGEFQNILRMTAEPGSLKRLPVAAATTGLNGESIVTKSIPCNDLRDDF